MSLQTSKKGKGRPNHIKCSFCKSNTHKLRTECRYLTNLKNLKWIYNKYFNKVNKIIKFYYKYRIHNDLVKIKYFLAYINREIKIYNKFNIIKKDKTAKQLRETIDNNNYFTKIENFTKFSINSSFKYMSYYNNRGKRYRGFCKYDIKKKIWIPIKSPISIINTHKLVFNIDINNISIINGVNHNLTITSFKKLITILYRFMNNNTNILDLNLPEDITKIILDYHIISRKEFENNFKNYDLFSTQENHFYFFEWTRFKNKFNQRFLKK